MKKITVVLLSILIYTFCFAPSAFAQKNPNRVTTWNRMTDFFATVGKGKQAKKVIIDSRKKSRREARLFKQRQKKMKKTQKKMVKEKSAILDKIKTRKTPYGRGGIDAQQN